ncbi:Lipoprotein nlpI [Vibrio nigripulchritudo SFn118]|nr:Lipoprotein nlpI [Vibrio nigripulchritudo SFn118]
MAKWLKMVGIVSALVLTGCASNQNQWLYPPMAVPLQPSIQQEVQIARLTQLLQRQDLKEEVRAKMFYERGNYYDSVGLRDLARLDFERSLNINPRQPDVYNLLGVYFTEKREFDAAYDAFDSTLELDPSNQYAERNRAIALYYGSRFELALEEMSTHYDDDPEDPFRALWLYLIEREVDAEAAKEKLMTRYEQRSERWGWLMVALMLEQISEERALKAIVSATNDNELLSQRLTETYFYLAKRYQLRGDYGNAISLYKLALSFNVYEYVEHRYSYMELGNIYSELKAEQAKDSTQPTSI